jgi:Gas vesicle protein K
MILHDRMSELCARYGLTMDDLDLDLGPLGTLLPPGRNDQVLSGSALRDIGFRPPIRRVLGIATSTSLS